ncbi:MAG: hypothetical protein WA979_04025 [Pacificimonas sp.]
MIRFPAIAAVVILTSLLAGTAFSPVQAAETACDTMPADIRAAAQRADTADARRALRKAEIGAALCEAGNERAARKKFAQALKSLGVSKEEFAQR